MRQANLNRAVARATGETVSTVKRLGFLLADPSREQEQADCPELGPEVIDWDALDLERRTSTYRGPCRGPAVC